MSNKKEDEKEIKKKFWGRENAFGAIELTMKDITEIHKESGGKINLFPMPTHGHEKS